MSDTALSNSIFTFWRNCQTAFKSGCTYSYEGSDFLTALWKFVIIFLIIDVLVGMT